METWHVVIPLRAHPRGAGPTRPFAHARVRRRPRRSRFDRRSGGARARARQARTPGRSVLGGDPSARPPHSGAFVAQDASPDRKPNPPPPSPGHGSHDPDPRPCRLPDRKDAAGRDTTTVPSPWALLVGLQGSWIAQENGDLSEGRSSREGWISGPSTPPGAEGREAKTHQPLRDPSVRAGSDRPRWSCQGRLRPQAGSGSCRGSWRGQAHKAGAAAAPRSTGSAPAAGCPPARPAALLRLPYEGSGRPTAG